MPMPIVANAVTRHLSALLEARTGQKVTANRAWRIETVLKPVLRHWSFDSVDALVAALPATPTGALADAVVDALLNQETSFFRDTSVVDQVVGAVDEMRAAGLARRLRLWSAGCSTGQEPLSLAMLLAEKMPDAMPDIVATDVSHAAIARARRASFSQFEIQRGLPMRRMVRWFEQVGSDWVASPEIVRQVSFRRHNLVADPAPAGQFDVILCRNVMMYFAPDVRRSVFDRLADALRPEGLLVLGAGETTIGQTDRFTPSARFRGFYDRAGRPR